MAGRKHSKETRDKISQTLKARWETEDGFRDRMVTMMRMARGNEEGAGETAEERTHVDLPQSNSNPTNTFET